MRAFFIRKHDHSNKIKPTTIFLTTTYTHKNVNVNLPFPFPSSRRSRINFEVLGKMAHTPSRLALVRCACVEFPSHFRKNGKRLLDNKFSCISDLHFIHHLRGSFKITCRKRSCLRTNKRIRAAPQQKTNPTNLFLSCRLRRRSSV